MQTVWRIELLGTLKASREGQVLTRFRTRRVASLLAYLAYFRQRVHSRDELAAMLWPDADIVVSRRNLRQALSSLRHVLEPAPMASGSVLLSIHDSVQLNPDVVTTDVAEFEAHFDRARRLGQGDQEFVHLNSALEEYKGDLLPGLNDEWIWSERLRLEDAYLSILRKLSETKDPDLAIAHLRAGLSREPYNEEWHRELMRRFVEVGRPDKALDQFAELESTLAETFGQRPSEGSCLLAEQAGLALGKEGPKGRKIAFEPIKTKERERRLSLPVYANRYFGRSEEIHLVCSNIEESRWRLLTILGPAGVGKTRMSVQCAWEIANRQDWNVWFVPLADRFSASELYEATIAAIDSQHGSSSTEIERIIELAGGRQTLLVLDNLEQIADDAGLVIGRLLEKMPNLTCLTSSRRPLQVHGEQVVPIEPLPLPMDDGNTLPELAQFPSIQLFVDRCQSIRPDLQLNARNSAAIMALCSRLDGLPLAIEIAAGLSSSFSPAQMLNHLPEKLTGLTSRRRDVPDRHKSLRSAIDWSYDSLSEELRTLFRHLCVFRGGFTLAAVGNVCVKETLGSTSSYEKILVAMQGLLERSLVGSHPSEDGREPRFSSLVAFREYAEELVSPEEFAELRERHAEFYLSQTPSDRPFASTEEQTQKHLAIELDYDNFTSAIEFSLAQGRLERCIRLLGILSIRWLARGPKAIERRLIKEVAHHSDSTRLSAQLRVQIQRMLGTTHIRSGEYQAAYEACVKAVQIASENGDEQLLATCYSGLSVCAGYLGRVDETLELSRRVLELAGKDNLILQERSHLGMGSAYCSQGRIAEAGAAFERARRISEKLRGGEPDALIVINQARVALDVGRKKEALRLAHESIRISKRLHDDFTLAVALTVVSRYHMSTGNLEAASATNLEALEKCKQGDFLFWILQCLRNQALVWVEFGRLHEAATILAATAEIVEVHRTFDVKVDQEALEKVRNGLPSADFEQAWARGLAMDRSAALRFVSEATDGSLVQR